MCQVLVRTFFSLLTLLANIAAARGATPSCLHPTLSPPTSRQGTHPCALLCCCHSPQSDGIVLAAAAATRPNGTPPSCPGDSAAGMDGGLADTGPQTGAPHVGALERAEALLDKGEAAWGVVDGAMSALASANTSVVAKGASAATDALLKVAGRFPLAGPIAGVLKDVWTLYQVRRC